MSDTKRSISRREALKATVLGGGVLVAPGFFISCTRGGHETTTAASTRDDAMLMEDIADTLLPTTAASPGAKVAGVGTTMALLLADCEGEDVQRRVAAGLQAFRETCRKNGGAFASLAQPERERLLREVDAAAQEDGESHWFSSVRQLALNAYFTSEIGATRATRYVAVPGRYEGCIPLKPGQPAWW